MDPRIAPIVAREMPSARIVAPEPAVGSAQVSPMLESERLLRKKYGPAAVTANCSQDPIQMVVVEYPSGRRETLVVDLSRETVIATSG